MAVNVRVTGPELLSEENRRGFIRIEESVRQYSAHTRESIFLIRRPLDHPADHFMLLWPHGIAVVELISARGTVRGSQSGYWYSENAAKEEQSSVLPQVRLREPRTDVFSNAYQTVLGLRKQLSNYVSSEGLPNGVDSEEIAMVAVFTAAQRLQVEPISDSRFSALTLEDALARSIMHRPNLLRSSEIAGSAYTNEQLERIFISLEAAAKERSKNAQDVVEPEAYAAIPVPPHERQRYSPYWLVLVLLVLAIFTYVMIRVVLIRSTPSSTTSPPKVVPHTPSEIIIETPVETELFISPFQFQTRAQLDRALTYGEGMRFLPDTEQLVVMDSLTLAKGVYGYFRVQESWRKGMLLQTLSHSDTIDIVKFLDPLP